MVYYILFQRRTKLHSSKKNTVVEAPVAWPGHDSAFYRLEKALAVRGRPRQPGGSASEYSAGPGAARSSRTAASRAA